VGLTPGWQLSHGFAGLIAPDATVPEPAMTHCLPHVPPLHVSPPVPQPVPSARLVHDVGPAAGWQLWQLLLGLRVPEVTNVPAMKQSLVRHVPDLQTAVLAMQVVPSVTCVNETVLVTG
jgi:hypothetical protein